MNDRIDTDKLLHCNNGFTMRHLIHSIVTIWLQHPNRHIVISKVDLDKAYHRLHATTALAASSGLTLSSMVGIYLRLRMKVTHPVSPLSRKEFVISQTCSSSANRGTLHHSTQRQLPSPLHLSSFRPLSLLPARCQFMTLLLSLLQVLSMFSLMTS